MSFMKWINGKRPNVKKILVKKYAATSIRTGITLLQTLLLRVMIESIFYDKNVNQFFSQVILYEYFSQRIFENGSI